MSENEILAIVEILYPYFLKKFQADAGFKNCIRSTNATVTEVQSGVSNIGQVVKVKLPYDTIDLEVINKSTSELAVGDLVCLHYYIDLKNAYVAYKV